MILALDQGTTSSRALLIDGEGRVRALAQREFRQIYPQPAWVEHDPNEIWSTQLGVGVEALAQANLTARDVTAIGITNQRETTIVWDRATGEPVANAIVWQDRRTAGAMDPTHASTITAKTGLIPDPYFSASKLAWILERHSRPGLAFGTVDSWLLYKLTGGRVHATDVSNASRTMLFDIHRGAWDGELLQMFRVPRDVLPEVRSSSEVFGEASAPGLEGIPIAGIAGDQQAALFGQACWSPGLTKNTYGTGCFMLENTGATPVPSSNRLLTTVAWKLANGAMEYALEGSVFIGGAVVQWLRDGLGLIRTSADIEPLAASVPDSGGVYLVPAFAGLGAPHWDPHARGAIVGITRGTSAGHIARAAVESIAYQVADLLDAMRADGGPPLTELRVDGGAARNDALLQFQADVLQVPVVRPKMTETTALGAAYLAGLATGFWPSREALGEQWQVDRRFEPRAPVSRERWHAAVERSKSWDR
ncbi:MAG: glycerol kinase GlpK [Bryobacteraceae bacterium]|nr:glycerol kinase GlpK [Bryobacteraceae bacterium]